MNQKYQEVDATMVAALAWLSLVKDNVEKALYMTSGVSSASRNIEIELDILRGILAPVEHQYLKSAEERLKKAIELLRDN